MFYEKYNKSYIFRENLKFSDIQYYYQYILDLIKYTIENNNLSVNFNLGLMHDDISDLNFLNNKTIKICINIEHTLVKQDGRSIPKNTPIGKIQYDQNKFYLVRIVDFHKLNSYDIVIDYSIPNLVNVKQSNFFDNFSKKHIYIAPCFYENLYINMNNRNIQSLTTFLDINQLRRKKLLEKISETNLIHSNVNDCFDKSELQKLYQNTKVIINIHQTPHHDTFEELRCLPALQNGVIVISEKSPLHHLIPYNNLIIWTDYESIVDKTKEVLENYEKYYQNVFTEKNINILHKMHDENKKVIESYIIKSL